MSSTRSEFDLTCDWVVSHHSYLAVRVMLYLLLGITGKRFDVEERFSFVEFNSTEGIHLKRRPIFGEDWCI